MDIACIVTRHEAKLLCGQDVATFRISQQQASNSISSVRLRTQRVPLRQSLRDVEISGAVVAVREIDSDLTVRSSEFETVAANKLGVAANKIVGLPEDRIIGSAARPFDAETAISFHVKSSESLCRSGAYKTGSETQLG